MTNTFDKTVAIIAAVILLFIAFTLPCFSRAIIMPSALEKELTLSACAVSPSVSDISAKADRGAATARYSVSGESVNKEAELRSDERVLTVLMYHQLLSKPRGKYIVTPEIFENDVLELLKRGYETVFPSELAAFVENGGYFPKKPLLITLDDGHYNSVYYTRPILEKYKCKAVVNIVGAYSEYSTSSGDHSKVAYSYLTWRQIAELKGGAFEVGNHTYSMHKYSPRRGVMRLESENAEQYTAALNNDIARLQTKLTAECGVTPICFAYPFGLFDKAAKNEVINMGFKIILNCFEKRNVIAVGKRECLYSVCRFNRPQGLSSEAFFNKIEKSKL